jgi:alanyl-tRNA synthetase
VLLGIERRVAELAAARTELAAAKRRSAVDRAPTLASEAVDGVLVARVEDLDRDSLRDLAVAVRDQGVASVALGTALESGGVALASAVSDESPLHAGEWIADAAKLVGGGGKRNPDVSVVGGRDSEQLDAALELIRHAVDA